MREANGVVGGVREEIATGSGEVVTGRSLD